MFQRWLLLLIATQLLSACGAMMSAKPVMPVEQGLTFYRADKTPAPTVVLLPGCGGASGPGAAEAAQKEAEWLKGLGFNTVLFDYVKITGLQTACYGQLKPDTFAKLAFDGLHYIAAQPFVDRNHIVLMGWSLGASAALTIAEKVQPQDQLTIAGVIAYYPGCYPGLELSTSPTLLLLGLADNVVNAYDCIALANKSPQTPLVLKTYWGAYHGFDGVENQPPKTAHFLWRKFTAAYDPDAASDAIKSIADFLRTYGGASKAP